MTDPIAEKIGVANLGDVYNQTNHITIHESEKTALIYSDPVPDVRLFQGRATELADLTNWLADPAMSMIGIHGEGGIGKSTLAAKAFVDCPGFQGKFWADVRQGTSVTALAERALKELGVPTEQVRDIEEKDLIPRLLRYVQQGRYLIAIDNLESVLTAEGEWRLGYRSLLDGFQQMGGASVLLLGSREYPPKYFGWRGAQWLRVDQGLAITDGAALLASLEVEDSAANRAKVSAQVQGHPLALALIAGWLRSAYRPGERQVAGLDNQADWFQLQGPHRGEEAISVAQVFEWSMERLTEAQRHVLTQVSVFRGAFNVEAVAALVDPQRNLAVDNALLDDLERRSLVEAIPEKDKSDSRPFRLQPRIQDFVQRRADDLEQAHYRAIAYFWSHRQTQFTKEDTRDAVFEYEETFYHECFLGRYRDAAATLTSCDEFLRRRGYYGVLTDLYGQLHACWKPSTEQIKDYAVICNNLGNAYQSLGDYAQAIDYQKRSLAIKQEIGDSPEEKLRQRNGEANSLIGLGTAYHSLGDYAQAIDYNQQALAIQQEIGDRNSETASLGNLGNAYGSLGDYAQSIDYQKRSLTITQEIGDRNGEAGTLCNLGVVCELLGEYAKAIDYQKQSLAITQEIGDRNGEAKSLGNLGNAYQSLGDYAQVINYQKQSLAISQEIGDRQGEAASLGNLGNVYQSLEDYAQAIDYQKRSLTIRQEIGDRQGEAASLGNLGNAYRALGDYAQAIDYQKQSLAIQQEIGDRQGEAASLGNLGNAYRALGDYAQAIDYQKQSLAIKQEIGDRNGEALSLWSLSLIYQSQGKIRKAREHRIAALKIWQALKLPLAAVPLPELSKRIFRAFEQEEDWTASILQFYESLSWYEDSIALIGFLFSFPSRLAQRFHIPKFVVWFAIGLGLAFLVWWLTQ